MLEVGLGESRRDHIPSLDGLRGVACLLVLIGHLGAQHWIPFVTPGGLGVPIFFALSGFLITRILLHGREHGVSLRRFYWHRALRIFPAYYLMIVGVLLVSGPGNLIPAATYTYNLVDAYRAEVHHTWSLCVEEHFYLVWPLVVGLLPLWGTRRLAVLAILGGWVAIGWYETHALHTGGAFNSELPYRWTPFRVPSLLVGALVAYAEPWLRSRQRFGTAGLACLAGSMIVPEALVVFGYYFGLGVETMANNAGTDLVAVAALLLTIRGASFLEAGWIRGVGRISYGLYLYHFPIYCWIVFVDAPQGTALLRSALAVGLTFGVAWASYRWFEAPIMRWGRGLATRSADHSTPLAPLGASHVQGQSLPGSAAVPETAAARV